jgi:hypothetical protein
LENGSTLILSFLFLSLVPPGEKKQARPLLRFLLHRSSFSVNNMRVELTTIFISRVLQLDVELTRDGKG